MAAKGAEVTWVRLRSKTTGEWFVHPELRPRMLAEAAEKGTNLTDLANEILCYRFGVPYTPNRRKSSPALEDDKINFGMSPELQRAISATYPKRWLDGVRYVLCAHYGLRVPPRPKQKRRRLPAAA